MITAEEARQKTREARMRCQESLQLKKIEESIHNAIEYGFDYIWISRNITQKNIILITDAGYDLSELSDSQIKITW